LSRDNVIREWSLDNSNFIIVQIPLVPLLVNLVHHRQGDAVLFSASIRLPTVINKICMGTPLAVGVAKLVNGFGESDSAAFLLQ
jgi:hypothetical protein